MTELILKPGQVSLGQLRDIYWNGKISKLDLSCRSPIEEACKQIEIAANGEAPVYGVNTGFGKLANIKINASDSETLQRNLILSHCCGVGKSIQKKIIRLMMTLKLLSFGRGASGVRWELVELLQQMIQKDIIPVIPGQGSVGASGDLAPLAHMTAAMIGEGQSEYGGSILAGADALAKAGLTPISLAPKEGLALINGTQFSTAFALAGLFEAWHAAKTSLITSAMSTDAIMGSTAPLQSEVHDLRGHRGQCEAAASIRILLDGSDIRESHREGDTRVQDPYCIRCQPQVTGAAMDVLRQASNTLKIEANAATDNPLVLTNSNRIVSGGNFHAEPVGFAADMIALAIAEIGAISQRRVALMVDPALSHNLPPFLTPNPGLNSGLMMAEVTTAALMSENKHLANPCVTDSTPTSANQEDHVSMAAHGARRLIKMTRNLNNILGVELICGAQGIEFRAPLKTSIPLNSVLERLRVDVAPIQTDRYLASDLAQAAYLVSTNAIIDATKINFPEIV